MLKQPAAAATAFEQALQLDATRRIYHLLGSAREAAGDRSGAIAAYQGELSQPYSQSTPKGAQASQPCSPERNLPHQLNRSTGRQACLLYARSPSRPPSA